MEKSYKRSNFTPFLLILLLLIVSNTLFSDEIVYKKGANYKNILIIYSGSEINIWESSFNAHIITLLNSQRKFNINLSIDFLNIDNIPPGEIPRKRIQSLQYKYQNIDFDIIIGILPGVNQFLINYREIISKNIPRIYVLPGNISPDCVDLFYKYMFYKKGIGSYI